jgi:hypothetical protein
MFLYVFVTSEQLFSLHNLAKHIKTRSLAAAGSILVHRHGKANLVSWSIIILGGRRKTAKLSVSTLGSLSQSRLSIVFQFAVLEIQLS